jgi:hypothetical protein
MGQKKVTNKNNVISTIATTLLILSLIFITAISSFLTPNTRPTNALSLQLQFPKSQKLDLMTINSGKLPTTNNFKLPPGYKIEPVLWNLTTPGS